MIKWWNIQSYYESDGFLLHLSQVLEQYWQPTDQCCFQCCFCAFLFFRPMVLASHLPYLCLYFWRNPYNPLLWQGRLPMHHPSPDKDLRLWSGPFRRYLLPPMPRYLFQNCLFHSKHASFLETPPKTLYSDWFTVWKAQEQEKNEGAATYDDFWVVGHVKVPEQNRTKSCKIDGVCFPTSFHTHIH